MQVRSKNEPDSTIGMRPLTITKSLPWLCSFGLMLGTLSSVEPASTNFASRTELYKFLEQKRVFEFDLDQDLNQFPDDWFVEEGAEFESYHRIELNSMGFKDNSSLAFGFSGGKMGVFSAPLVLENRYAYNISLQYRSEGLDSNLNHRLDFGLRAYDKNNRLIKTFESKETSFGPDWIRSENLRIEELPSETKSCVLFIHLSGRSSGMSQLMIDRVQVEASPRIRLTTGQPLNTFESDQNVSFEQSIEGTDPGKSYEHILEIRDFMGNFIGPTERKTLMGQLDAITIKKAIPDSKAGVYYIHAQLLKDGQIMVDRNEIVAKDTSSDKSFSNEEFGVLIGNPKAPFEPLLESLALLGTKISKLELVEENFSLLNYSTAAGLMELNPLLRKMAPDSGYKFIAVINQVPEEAMDKYHPPANAVVTFASQEKAWVRVLDDLVLHYGNVFSDWQLGGDAEMVTDDQLKAGQSVIEHLHGHTDWMNIVLPGTSEQAKQKGYLQNKFIASDTPDLDLVALLDENKNQRNLNVTIELGSSEKMEQLPIIEDMVRRITYLKASMDAKQKPLVSRMFLDRLSGKHRGLMTENYQPQSTYFAAKTMIYWMKGAEFIGQFQNPDHEVESHVFIRGAQAFSVFWRKPQQDGQRAESKEVEYHLGRDLRVMDLMGNDASVLQNDDRLRMFLGSTPLIVISPNPELWETMLSLKLKRDDVKAKVELQDQEFSFTNYFAQQGKFDCELNYPKDWTLDNTVFSRETISGVTANQPFKLSPSPLFPLNHGVPVFVDMEVSLPDQHHQVKIYREDHIHSEVTLGCSFFKDPKGLKMDVHLSLSSQSTKASTFLVSVQLPDGEVMETFFKGVQPGDKVQNSLFILDGDKYIGREVVITARESIGQRYLNASFPIKTIF